MMDVREGHRGLRALLAALAAAGFAISAYLVFGTVRLRLAGSDALKTADRR
jgi:tRNA nucleotidyltransferase/poly(A) polymerase